jgi:hypothetical protein
MNYFRLVLPHMGSQLKVTLWASETPEQFIMHVRSAIHACKQMEHDIKLSGAEQIVANAILDLEIKIEEYVQVCSSKRKDQRESRRRHTCCLRVLSSCSVSLKKPHRL